MGEPKDPSVDAAGRRRGLLWIALGAALLLLAAQLFRTLRQGVPPPAPSPPAQSRAPLTAEAAAAARAAIREIVAAASHASLRQPDFPDQRRAMEGLYAPADFAPVWFEDGRPRDQARDVIEVLKQAETRGLPPVDDVTRLEAWWSAAQAAPGLAPRELGLFDAALSLLYMRHLSDVRVGRANPGDLRIDFEAEPRRDLRPEIVRDVVARHRVRAAIDEAEPPFEQYRRLKAALPRFRALARDRSLSPVPEVRKLSPGDEYGGAAALARLLAALGELPAAAAERWTGARTQAPCYEGALVEAVKRFQERHGLAPDGVIGGATFARLNLSMPQRVRLIELALERLRWLRPPTPGPAVIVNIAGFRLWAFDLPLQPGSEVLTTKVVVGRALRHQTPVLGEQMKYVVFRPYWNIPASIVRDETLPAARREPGYLDAQEMEIVTGDRDDSPVVPATPESLEQVERGGYRIRQRPGAKNALGRVKFIFPNNANVFLHDTPSQGVFARSRRDLSHGCVRVAEPAALAEWVLRGIPGWTRERVEQAMAAESPQQVNLPRPIPVLLFYATVVAGAEGRLAFFEDIYGHDQRLEESLRRREQAAAKD